LPPPTRPTGHNATGDPHPRTPSAGPHGPKPPADSPHTRSAGPRATAQWLDYEHLRPWLDLDHNGIADLAQHAPDADRNGIDDRTQHTPDRNSNRIEDELDAALADLAAANVALDQRPPDTSPDVIREITPERAIEL
jgi:hypothetical protein